MLSGSKEITIHVDWKYADDFKRVYATNAFGIAGDYDYKITFGVVNTVLQQDPTTQAKAEGEYTAEVTLSFRALKELRNALDEGIKAVEARFGEIKLPRRPEDIFRQP
jgi:hypothetical protein